jgi:hypothetical protein
MLTPYNNFFPLMHLIVRNTCKEAWTFAGFLWYIVQADIWMDLQVSDRDKGSKVTIERLR